MFSSVQFTLNFLPGFQYHMTIYLLYIFCQMFLISLIQQTQK